MSCQKPKGTDDILPGTSEKWQSMEETARLIFKGYQYQEIRTPIFEHYEVVSRSAGDTTDVVPREMYGFYDKGNRHMMLRPEGTAPIVRAFVENELYGPEYTKPYRTYYMRPMFRCEHPQVGRLRQFHQIGVEAFGSENPALSIEIIAMALDFFKQLDTQQVRLIINSLEDKETRATYRQALIDYLKPHMAELSGDSRRRLHENPLQVSDSRDKEDKVIIAEAPSILDCLDEPSKAHFETVTDMLDLLEIPYKISSNMVRGLDYYTHTIFEIMSETPKMGAQLTICAGGRYDDLVEELSNPGTPGFDFGVNIERVLLTMEAEKVVTPALFELDAYMVGTGSDTSVAALQLVRSARGFGSSADRDYMNRKPKAQFKTADKLRAKSALTIGKNELNEDIVNVKSMATYGKKAFPLSAIHDSFDEVYDEMVTKVIEE